MSTRSLISYLLDEEGAGSPTQVELAQRLFGDGGAPENIVSSTLSAMHRELDNFDKEQPVALYTQKRNTPRLWLGGLAALAAAVLIQFNVKDVDTTQAINPTALTQTDNMTPKGLEAAAPEVSLELAVLSGGTSLERFSSEQTYGTTDSFFFRAGASATAEIALFHIEGGVVTTLLQTRLEQGETDLSVDNSPAQWRFEDGDQDSTFLIASLPDDISLQGVEQTINDTLRDGDADLCESLRMIGCQCDYRAVMVSTE